MKHDLRAALEAMPPGTLVPTSWVIDQLARDAEPVETRRSEPTSEPTTWRERIWYVPSELRLGVKEAAEAIARSSSWLYKRTGPAADNPIPCRRLDGELVFLAGELRAWIRDREQSVHEGRSDPPTLRIAS